jgi:hypothetical protein
MTIRIGDRVSRSRVQRGALGGLCRPFEYRVDPLPFHRHVRVQVIGELTALASDIKTTLAGVEQVTFR